MFLFLLGLLACDRFGDGKMVNLDIIELASESAFIYREKSKFLTKDLKNISFLVSAGPTVEDLDPARQLTNRSSGRMGVLIAQAARFRGAEVDLVHGPIGIQEDLFEGLNAYPVRSSTQMGAKIDEHQDGLTIYGGNDLKGCDLDSEDDHRVAMSLAIASIMANSNSILRRSEAAAISYPDFWSDLKRLHQK